VPVLGLLWCNFLQEIFQRFVVILTQSIAHCMIRTGRCRGVIIPTPLVDFSERSLYRARIAFLRGATAISKIDGHFFYFFIYRPEILHTPRGRQCAHSCQTEFWISSPKKFGAPLNFAFALRPMGRKISNRLYSSFKSCFELIYSYILGRRCKNLTWLFRKWEIF